MEYSTTNHISLHITMARRLLLTPPSLSSPPPAAATEPPVGNTFDANVVLVLSVLLCALICSLGLNSIVRCALRCSHFVPAAGQLSSPAGAAAAANTGIKKNALKTFPTVAFSDGQNLDAECVICLSDFAAGDVVKILPKCNHGFHVRCIDKWLGSHSSCPTCRHCLLDTCRKIVGGKNTVAPVVASPVIVDSAAEFTGDSSSTLTPTTLTQPEAVAVVAPHGAVVIGMPPLEAEAPVREQRIKSVFFWRKN